MSSVDVQHILSRCHIQPENEGTYMGSQIVKNKNNTWIQSYSPIDGQLLGSVNTTSEVAFKKVVKEAHNAFEYWKNLPAPKRGEVIRQVGNKLREYKEPLGQLVSLEMGKSLQEGLGEVQEMIDICDFAVGLSRQLYGLTMHSERPQHRMYEQWHPLGIVGIISAFNFPVAVWMWNAALSWVCGNVCIWKPSEKTPLTALASQKIVQQVFQEMGVPNGVSCLVNGDKQVGEWLSQHPQVALVSATGSVRMGKAVAATVAQRLGKTILELGGNNAVIVSEKANIDLALRAIVFGAVGTAGQRCTTIRRLIVHQSIYQNVISKLKTIYGKLKIGNPLNADNHLGPLIDEQAVKAFLDAVNKATKQGGKIIYGGKKLTQEKLKSGFYVEPTLIAIDKQTDIVKHETFAPILYIMPFNTLDEAIRIQNEVPQGLSSAIMTDSLKEAELFLSVKGSDCGIANVNIGTSGAEIGGAFGGEKETGGGRESGSDSWKYYMRRQTSTINFSHDLPLAQGIQFDI